MTKKERERLELEKAMADFEKNGGEIEVRPVENVQLGWTIRQVNTHHTLKKRG